MLSKKVILKGFDDRYQKLVEEIRRRAKKGGNFLDMGCGNGDIWQFFSNLNVWGVDRDKLKLSQAKKVLRPVLAKVEKLPWEKEFFDGVVMSEVLEHLIEPEKAMAEAARVLKPDGWLLVSFPNIASWQTRLGIFWAGFNPAVNYPLQKEHIRFFNFRDFEGMAVELGLEVEKIRGVSFLSFTRETIGFYLPVPRNWRYWGGDRWPKLAFGIVVVLRKRK